MKYKGYTGVVQFDEEAETFFGKVINIRDTVTFQATDAHDLRREFEASVEDYLDFCNTTGHEPEPPSDGEFSLYLPLALCGELAAAAASEGISLNEYIVNRLSHSA